MALAGLVALLALPLLAFDSPAAASGVETSATEESQSPADAPVAAPDLEAAVDVTDPDPDPDIDIATAVEVVVIEQPVTPDVGELAQRASAWAQAREQAIADGLVEVRPPATSDTDLGLLPVVAEDSPAVEEEPATAPEAEAANPDPEEEPATPAEPEPAPVDEEPEPVDEEPDPEPVEEEPEPEADPVAEEPAPVNGPPTAPAQVDGRVPPPAGGPTAAQWDELRFCESTHNYEAINNTGTYRGAYQFSQQTWDWVSGIHWPHLVGVDPASAQPEWQDVMAYTLYAMRGWDQWPVCGRNLL